MRPFYQDELVRVYCADARDWLAQHDETFEAVITDPVWPIAPDTIPGHDEHAELLAAVSRQLVGRANRLVLHLGSTCDPRWLSHVPPDWPFYALQHLEYAMPSFRGRVLTNDIAYVFGTPPPGRSAFPGRVTCSRPMDPEARLHPAPRALEHVQALIRTWATAGPVLDPFAGSLTTALACKHAGIPCVAVERAPSFCAIGIGRLRQSRMVFS